MKTFKWYYFVILIYNIMAIYVTEIYHYKNNKIK